MRLSPAVMRRAWGSNDRPISPRSGGAIKLAAEWGRGEARMPGPLVDRAGQPAREAVVGLSWRSSTDMIRGPAWQEKNSRSGGEGLTSLGALGGEAVTPAGAE